MCRRYKFFATFNHYKSLQWTQMEFSVISNYFYLSQFTHTPTAQGENANYWKLPTPPIRIMVCRLAVFAKLIHLYNAKKTALL